MAVLCEDRKLLFLLTPRTGSTAIGEHVMIHQWNGRYIPSQSVTDAFGRVVVPKKHASLRELIAHGVLAEAARDELTVFTTVRNPFESLASLYLKQRHVYQPLLDDPASWVHKSDRYRESLMLAAAADFPTWLRHRSISQKPVSRMARRIRGGPKPRHFQGAMREGVDVVLRYEHLDGDFTKMLTARGFERTPIPTRNVTSKKSDIDWKSLYDDASKRLVSRLYRPTLTQFGYAWSD